MTDERISMDVLIKGERYHLISWYTTIDVEKKRLRCHARLPDTGKEPVGGLSFFIPIEFDKITIENLQRAGITVSEHIT